MKFIKGRCFKHGEKVYVYFNLHKHCFSVKALEGKYKGLVVAHCEKLVLTGDIEFSVSEKRRQKVLATKHKNVHAGIKGKLDLTETNFEIDKECTYNPYLYDSFVYMDTKEPIKEATSVLFESRKVYTLKKDL